MENIGSKTASGFLLSVLIVLCVLNGVETQRNNQKSRRLDTLIDRAESTSSNANYLIGEYKLNTQGAINYAEKQAMRFGFTEGYKAGVEASFEAADALVDGILNHDSKTATLSNYNYQFQAQFIPALDQFTAGIAGVTNFVRVK